MNKTAATIIQETKRLENLVNEFSKFARLPYLKKQMQDMKSTLDEIVIFFQGAYSELDLETQFPHSECVMEYDSDQLKQVLINIVTNAIEASAEARKYVRIELTVKEETALIAIRDRSGGIPDDNLDKVFEPYFTTKQNGTGLGLVIAEKIIMEHNGNIWFDSNNVGTTFYIELPLNKEEQRLKNTILIVDDEAQIRETISDILGDMDYDVISLPDGNEIEKVFLTHDIDTVILDVMLPRRSGLEILGYLHKEFQLIPVIIISGHGDIKMAVDAMKLGAYDFIEKPLSIERIISSVRNAIRIKELQTENISLRSKLEQPLQFIGNSEVVKSLLAQLPNVAQSDASVMITGENGTGKELIARLIHQYSKRKSSSFIGVNCAAIPETLIESELFGYERGAFTERTSRRRASSRRRIRERSSSTKSATLAFRSGKGFESASGTRTGTVGGGNEVVKIDVRVIAATNKDLGAEIGANRFRQDLFYRLNVIPIHIPSLRERKDDIPMLVKHFIAEQCAKNHSEITVAKNALNVLKNKNWPGNVRELRNFVERLVVLANKTVIEAEDVMKFSFPAEMSVTTDYENCSLRDAKHQFEKGLIINR